VLVENFTNRVLTSRIIDTYVATAFFATLVYFVLNAHAYTAIEMIFGVVLVTIAFKGLSHMMLSLVVLLYNFDNKKESAAFDETKSRIDGLLNDLSLQQTKIKSQQSQAEE
jgi:hypothetical protein